MTSTTEPHTHVETDLTRLPVQLEPEFIAGSEKLPGTPPSLADRFVGRKYVQLVLVLGSLAAIGPLTIDTYLPALPTLTRELGATDAAAQLTLTGVLAGLGFGQLISGPLSDAFGRRRPLIVGLIGYFVMSLLCAIAPSVEMLTITRIGQGLLASAVAVTGMAVIRDLFVGIKAAKLLSRLVLVMGLAPILAPSLGSAMLTLVDWRGIFVVLAIAAVLLLVVAIVGLPETLPPERRLPANVGQSLKAYGRLFGDRTFVVMVLVAGFMFATVFAYVGGSPFILQNIFGLSPQQFGLAFGLNAFGLILSSQFNPALVKRFGPARVMTVAVCGGFVAAVTMLTVALLGIGGLVGFMVPLWFVVAACGLSFPNAPAIALSRHGDSAGTAAAMLGSAQFMIGGLTAPLVGTLTNGTAVPLAAVVSCTTAIAATLLITHQRQLRAVAPVEAVVAH